MSFDLALARVSEIRAFMGAGTTPQVQTPPPAATQATSAPSFASRLASATAATAPAPAGYAAAAGTDVGSRIVSLAQAELDKGVAEFPPGSNSSPDIARYRTATTGAMDGAPWCAYFVSYIAKEAGVPIGDHGQGMGLVDNITAWAQRTNRFHDSSETPQPGDLVLFDEHVGIVKAVNADGTLTTIEGNHSDKVDQVQRSPAEIVGYARLG